jgi:transcription termination/antitermination protein NusG
MFAACLPQEWFALYVKGHTEQHVADVLAAKGYETFVPLYVPPKAGCGVQGHHPFSPLLPQYVFFRTSGETYGPALSTTGVIGLVGTGRVPSPIPIDEITALGRCVKSGLQMGPSRIVSQGEKVWLCAGPLKGIEGVVVKRRKRLRLVLAINVLQRAVFVEVDDSWISPHSLPPDSDHVNHRRV